MHHRRQLSSDAGYATSSDAGHATSIASLKLNINKANEHYGSIQTPYGRIIKTMMVDADVVPEWEYVCPFAFLYYMCSVNGAFADIMNTCCEVGQMLRVVPYADNINPGNPFRPEKSRTIQCTYCCVVDWPGWLLQRSGVWPGFGFLRDSVIAKVASGLGHVMALILNTMFLPGAGPSFQTGFVLPDIAGTGRTVTRGIFGLSYGLGRP